jgi:hypothetical protein
VDAVLVALPPQAQSAVIQAALRAGDDDAYTLIRRLLEFLPASC